MTFDNYKIVVVDAYEKRVNSYRLIDIWNQYNDDGENFINSIFTKKAQQYILKQLGIETKDLDGYKVKSSEETISNCNIEIIEFITKDNELLIKAYIERFTGTVNKYGNFVGVSKVTVVHFQPEDIGLTKLLPDCAVIGIRNGVHDIKYGAPGEKEELLAALYNSQQ